MTPRPERPEDPNTAEFDDWSDYRHLAIQWRDYATYLEAQLAFEREKLANQENTNTRLMSALNDEKALSENRRLRLVLVGEQRDIAESTLATEREKAKAWEGLGRLLQSRTIGNRPPMVIEYYAMKDAVDIARAHLKERGWL